MIANSKCLTGKNIQLFVDNELTIQDRYVTEQHLASCAECKLKIKDRAEWTCQVKKSLGKSKFNPIEIPEFRNNSSSKKPVNKRHILYSLLKIAAVILIFLCGAQLFLKKKTPVYQPTAEDLLLWEEATSGNDANYDWHNRHFPSLVTIDSFETISQDINKQNNKL